MFIVKVEELNLSVTLMQSLQMRFPESLSCLISDLSDDRDEARVFWITFRMPSKDAVLHIILRLPPSFRTIDRDGVEQLLSFFLIVFVLLSVKGDWLLTMQGSSDGVDGVIGVGSGDIVAIFRMGRCDRLLLWNEASR